MRGAMLTLGLTLTAALPACGPAGQQPVAAPTKSDIGGPFKLVDQNGRVVTDKDLLGKPSLVF